ncbi:hypothetical protein HMPREF9418_1386 [Neisseria macacae ATCC 33926]|uniref:Uncharacterized protein n=1 Tax=Neisseria macacae ATCC 33926 TaxID=997348 RepID=A0AA36UJ91_9NEIS|nr:hypothetical protein HMPREF9418_1386 [Neisseria macacae ATCC 33926]
MLIKKLGRLKKEFFRRPKLNKLKAYVYCIKKQLENYNHSNEFAFSFNLSNKYQH